MGQSEGEIGLGSRLKAELPATNAIDSSDVFRRVYLGGVFLVICRTLAIP
jgi:hypothetical protein